MYEDWVLLNESLRQPRHNPLEDLKFVAGLNPAGPSRTCSADEGKCTWLFAPGTHRMYTSTNFLLAGLVVLAHVPPGQDSWQTLDPAAVLDPAGSSASFRAAFPHTAFPGVGALDTVGLTSVGSCASAVAAGTNVTEIYHQDASIMGWCYGNTVSSANDVARFYYQLLGTDAIVSRESRAVMQEFTISDRSFEREHKMKLQVLPSLSLCALCALSLCSLSLSARHTPYATLHDPSAVYRKVRRSEFAH